MGKKRILAAVLAAAVLGTLGGPAVIAGKPNGITVQTERVEAQKLSAEAEGIANPEATADPAEPDAEIQEPVIENGIEKEAALSDEESVPVPVLTAEPLILSGAEEEINLAAEYKDRYIIGDYTTEAGIPSTGSLEVNRDVPRLTDVSARLSWDAGKGRTFTFYNVSDPAQKIPAADYSYANMWVYNSKICKDADGKTSQLSWVIRTGNSAADTGNHYYRCKLTVDWVGWKLVSIPLSTFEKNNQCAWDYGVCMVTIAANEWVGNTIKWTENHSINVEKMWLSKTAPAASFQIAGTSIENGAGYVPQDLGGERTYTITASQEIAAGSTAGRVVVKQDEKPLAADAYTVRIEGKELRIVFSDDLVRESSYTIQLEPGIYDLDGNLLDEADEYSFTVEGPTRLFKVLKTSIANSAQNVDTALGANIKAGEKPVYTLNTNNPIDKTGLSGKVRLYKNNILQYDGFAAAAEDNRLELRFDSVLSEGAEYRIQLTDAMTDVYGNSLVGDRSFSFTTSPAVPAVFELAAFDSEESLGILNVGSKGCTITADNANRYGRSLRIDIPKSPEDRTARAAGIPVDGSKYKYANYWIYSPENTGKYLNLCLYTTDSNGEAYFMTRLQVDWVGWKLVSLELANYGASKGAQWQNVNGFSINANGWLDDGSYPSWKDGGFIQVERIWLSSSKAGTLELQGTTLPQNAVQMPVRDMSVGFVYSDSLNSCADGNVVLKQDGQSIPKNLVTDLQDNQLTVTAADLLEPGQTYTIEVGRELYSAQGSQVSAAAAYTFTTAESGLNAGKPELTDLSGMSAGAKVKVQNTGTEAKEAVLHLAFYGEGGSMLTQELQNELIPAGTEKELVIPASNAEHAVLIKAFVTDDKDALLYGGCAAAGAEAAASPRIYQGGAGTAQAYVTDCALTEQLLQIRGELSGGPNCVLLSLRDGTGTAVLSAPVIPDQNGIFQYYYDFGELKSGAYTLKVSGYQNARSAEKQVNYLDSADRAALLQTINSAQSGAAAAQALLENAGALGIAELTTARINGIAEALYENKPYGEYLTMTEEAARIQSLIEELNHTKWSSMTSFLQKNEAMIMRGSAAYQKYLTLTEKQKNAVNQIVVDSLPVDSFGDFRTAFAAALQKYENENKGSSKPSGGGGGSGGNRGGSTTIGVDHEAYKPDPVAPWEEAPQAVDIFTDLSSVGWAKDSIMALYEKGVVSPAADSRFRPEDAVIREEFVKLLTTALGVTAAETCSFTDAESGAWYVPYLAAAEAAGIVQGNPDGTFGVGQEIAREDMAVMVCRAAGQLEKTLPEQVEKQAFTDDTAISDYAAEAVYTMQMAGILSGMGDGSFMPRETASRAQAAKVIASLMAALS